MSRNERDIVVIGTSAGGLEALDILIGQLPDDLPATIFIVQHHAPEDSGIALLHRLGKYESFHCKLAVNGETFKKGRIYIAPPDCHLLVKKTTVLVTKGARENRYRPGIDPLFRSAAVEHGHNVIGVLLTGMLDDGTAGLAAIQKCGGAVVIQDPKDAAYPDMPQNALNNVETEYCVPLVRMGASIEKLVREAPDKSKTIPNEVRTEAEIAERVLSDVAQVGTLGPQVPYNCPNCGGVLWEMEKSETLRYRCHTGHSYTAKALLVSQTEKIEETLWVSLRMMEESRNLLKKMEQKTPISPGKKNPYVERAKEVDVHIKRIRAMLLPEGD